MRKHLVTAAVLASLAVGVAPATAAIAVPAAGVAATTSAAATPTLKPGSRGPAVTRVQRILEIKQTGVFDAATVTAVKRFQKAHGISSSGGYVGPRTWAALRVVETKQKTMRDRAMTTFRKVSSATEKSLSSTAKVISLQIPGYARLAAPDVKLLIARVDRARVVLAAANKAAAAATTAGQVEVALAPAKRAHAASSVIELQVGAAWIARPSTFSAMLTDYLDHVLAAAKESGRSVDPAAESAARAKVLKTGAAAQKVAAQPAIKLLSIDPLAPSAAVQAANLSHLLIAALDNSSAGQGLDMAMEAYSQLVLG